MALLSSGLAGPSGWPMGSLMIKEPQICPVEMVLLCSGLAGPSGWPMGSLIIKEPQICPVEICSFVFWSGWPLWLAHGLPYN